jgi:hypothetical protein
MPSVGYTSRALGSVQHGIVQKISMLVVAGRSEPIFFSGTYPVPIWSHFIKEVKRYNPSCLGALDKMYHPDGQPDGILSLTECRFLTTCLFCFMPVNFLHSWFNMQFSEKKVPYNIKKKFLIKSPSSKS